MEGIMGYMVLSLAIGVYGIILFLAPIIIISRLGNIVKELKELNQKMSKS
ncbi:MAG: hypothetical protein Q7J67_00345 [bacterium]|nr:hypothetical protein [bacterium]